MVAAQAGQDVDLDQVPERQERRTSRRERDDARGAGHPLAQRGGRQAQVRRGLADAVGRHVAWVSTVVEIDLGHPEKAKPVGWVTGDGFLS